MPENQESVSVVIPCYNEERYLRQVLTDVLGQDYPENRIEVLVIDGKSTDKTREIANEFQAKHSNVRLIDNPHKYVPYAMNKGIEMAKGDVIVRLDAHASYPSNYVSMLVRALRELDADNVGGLWRTDVKRKTPTSIAIKKVLSHPLGVGNSLFRIGVGHATEVDTVPFGCYRKEKLRDLGGYNVKLVRNQDIELNKRLIQCGGKIMLVPEVFCTYYARETFSEMARNNFQNGIWNIFTVYLTRDFRSLSPRHFAPLMLVLCTLAPLALLAVDWRFGWLSLLTLLVYATVIGIMSARMNRGGTTLVHLVAGFFALHFSYGLGSLVGLSRIDKLLPG